MHKDICISVLSQLKSVYFPDVYKRADILESAYIATPLYTHTNYDIRCRDQTKSLHSQCCDKML